MKRIIPVLFALVMFFPFFYRSPSADALDDVWVKEFYNDKFGDPTDEFYLTNKTMFEGTYNSDSVNKENLGANLILEGDKENLLAYVVLFLNSTDQLKNGSSTNQNYEISVKKTDGSQFTTTGVMPAGKARIEIYKPIDLAVALTELDGEIKIYIEEAYQENNNYLFTAKCGNFKDLFYQEIITPIREEQYQEAEELLAQKRYEEAFVAFKELGDYDYKDSKTKAEQAKEAMNSAAYAIAESLLAQEKYDEAFAAFKRLGDYRDSKTKAEEAQRATASTTVLSPNPKEKCFVSDTGTPLNIHADLEAKNMGTDRVDLGIKVYCDSYSLFTTTSVDTLIISVNGQTISFNTPAIEIPLTTETVSTLLNAHTFQIYMKDIKDGQIPIDIVWLYDGSYAGVFLEKIECGGTLILP